MVFYEGEDFLINSDFLHCQFITSTICRIICSQFSLFFVPGKINRVPSSLHPGKNTTTQPYSNI